MMPFVQNTQIVKAEVKLVTERMQYPECTAHSGKWLTEEGYFSTASATKKPGF